MKKMKSRHSSGTNAQSNMRTGPGPVKGAGEVMTGGPGRAAMRVKPHMAGANFTGGANSYKPPRMSKTNQGE